MLRRRLRATRDALSRRRDGRKQARASSVVRLDSVAPRGIKIASRSRIILCSFSIVSRRNKDRPGDEIRCLFTRALSSQRTRIEAAYRPFVNVTRSSRKFLRQFLHPYFRRRNGNSSSSNEKHESYGRENKSDGFLVSPVDNTITQVCEIARDRA